MKYKINNGIIGSNSAAQNNSTAGLSPYIGVFSNANILPASIAATLSTQDPYRTMVEAHIGASTSAASTHCLHDASGNGWDEYMEGMHGQWSVYTNSSFESQSNTYWASIYDASNYHQVTDTVALRLGASAFTIEFWVMPQVTDTGNRYLISKGSASTGWTVWLAGGNKIAFTFDTSSTIADPTILAADTWAHVALVRTSTAANGFKIYINGVNTTTGTVASTLTETNWMFVGADRVATRGITQFSGCMADVRINNTAVYTTAFTRPTTALGVIAGTVYLQSMTSRGIADISGTTTFADIGDVNPARASYFTPFADTDVTGNASNYFSDYPLYIMDTQTGNTSLILGTGAFTIESWFCAGDGNRRTIIGKKAQGGAGWELVVTTSNILEFWDGETMFASTKQQTQTGEWHHAAVVRSNTSANGCKLYLDGVVVLTFTCATNFTGTDQMQVAGSRRTSGLGWKGSLSNLRISKSALYTTAFTPSTVLTATTGVTSYLSLQDIMPATTSPVAYGTCKDNFRRGSAELRTTPGPLSASSWSAHNDGTVFNAHKVVRNANFTFGTGDFSFEGWHKNRYSWDTTSERMLYDDRSVPTDSGLVIRLNGAYALEVMQGLTSIACSQTLFRASEWHHFCIQRVNGVLTLYIDGKIEDESACTLSFGNPGDSKFCGSSTSGVIGGMYGNLSNIRVQKGAGAYVKNGVSVISFDKPTASPIADSNTVFLAFHSPIIKDFSGTAIVNTIRWGNYPATDGWDLRMVPVGPFQEVFNLSKHDLGQSYDGSDYTYTPSSTRRPLNKYSWMVNGVKPWTLEGWIYPTEEGLASPSSRDYMRTANTVGQVGFQLVTNYNGSAAAHQTLNFRVFANNTVTVISSPVDAIRGWAWNHYAIVYDPTSATKMAMFINGASVATSNAVLYPGVVNSTSAQGFDFCMTNINHGHRISTIARYLTTATTIPIPTTPQVVDSNTWMLYKIKSPNVEVAQRATVFEYGTPVISYNVRCLGIPSIKFNQYAAAVGVTDRILIGSESWVRLKTLSPRKVDVTIEGWGSWGSTTLPEAGKSVIFDWNGSVVQLRASSTGKWRMAWGNQDTVGIDSNVSIARAPNWDHFVLTRTGMTWTLFINGTWQGELDVGTVEGVNRTEDQDTGILCLGCDWQASSITCWKGYLSDVRFTAGISRYRGGMVAGVHTMVNRVTGKPGKPTTPLLL